jgi:putative transposase
VIAAQHLPVQLACRVLGVSESGYYDWRSRPPSTRSVRHAWLTEQIRGVHQSSFGTYGSRRVHAELRLGLGVLVGHGAVEMLMRRAGLVGLPGRKRCRRLVHDTGFAGDLVDRNFARHRPDELWVTDITEHPTREGKLYCAVVLDVHARRVVGWSIDASQTAALATNALSMAIANRNPRPSTGAGCGTVIHSDHGVQGGFNWSSQHLDLGGVDGQADSVDEGADWSGVDEVPGGAAASAGGGARVLA